MSWSPAVSIFICGMCKCVNSITISCSYETFSTLALVILWNTYDCNVHEDLWLPFDYSTATKLSNAFSINVFSGKSLNHWLHTENEIFTSSTLKWIFKLEPDSKLFLIDKSRFPQNFTWYIRQTQTIYYKYLNEFRIVLDSDVFHVFHGCKFTFYPKGKFCFCLARHLINIEKL